MNMQRQITRMDKIWAKRWMRETMSKLGYEHLSGEVEVIFQPMTSKVGLAEWQNYRKINTGYRVAIGNMTIFLSELYWPDMSRKDKYETIVHECCHLIDAYERDIIKNPHGPTWFSLMERLGVNPEVGYSFQVSI